MDARGHLVKSLAFAKKFDKDEEKNLAIARRYVNAYINNNRKYDPYLDDILSAALLGYANKTYLLHLTEEVGKTRLLKEIREREKL